MRFSMYALLKETQKLSKKLYELYAKGTLTQREYLKLLKPLDKEIDNFELEIFNTHLPSTSAFEK